MPDYTGPGGPSRLEWEVWFNRFIDFIQPIHARGYGIVCHPDDRALMLDALDRAKDLPDQWAHDTTPALFVADEVPRGTVQPIDGDTGMRLTMRDINRSDKGFGRWGGLAAPGRDGITDPFKVYRDDEEKGR